MSTLSPPPLPAFKKTCPLSILPPPFISFSCRFPPPMGEVMKIPHPLKKGSGGGRPNYAPPPKVRITTQNSNLK